MSIQSKKLFLSELQERFDEYIPAKLVKQIIADILEVLEKYDLVALIEELSVIDNSIQLIELFINAKAVDGLSRKSLSLYDYQLRRMYEAVQVPVTKMQVDHIRQYVANELARGISKKTVQGHERTIFQFFKWLHTEELIQRNPCTNMKTIKISKSKKEPFSAEEIQLIKESASNEKELAIIHFLLASGCRVGELVSISRNDIDWKNLKLNVTGKGAKTREVYFDEVSALMMQRYLSKRKDSHPALFFNSKGKKRYTENGIQEMMRRISRRTGIHVYPHRFRHTLAQTLLDRGMNIEEVAIILGHEKLDTTLNYAQANQKNTENNYRKFACM